MIYLDLQRGLLGHRRRGAAAAPRCATRRSGWPACCCACSATSPRSWGCSRCCCCSTRARRRASTPTARIVLLEDQDRARWDRQAIAEGLALLDKADAPPPSRALPGAGGDRGAARSRAHAPPTPTGRRSSTLYATLERLHAVAGGDAQPGGRCREAARPGRGARDDRAAGADSCPATFTSSACAARCSPQLGRRDEARAAFDRAIALANTAAEAAHIRMHLDRLAPNL